MKCNYLSCYNKPKWISFINTIRLFSLRPEHCNSEDPIKKHFFNYFLNHCNNFVAFLWHTKSHKSWQTFQSCKLPQ